LLETMSEIVNSAIFAGYYKNLAKIAEFIRQAAQDAGFDSATIYQIELAVDEACSNIIEHAYGGEGLGDIECSYEISPRSLTIKLKDYGKPFKPETIEEPDLKAPLYRRANHGLGLHFIRELIDEVSFDFDQKSGNILTLVKYRN
jgi:serine/threonine-protein kinase RsbW